MLIVFFWLVGALIIGVIASDRTLGFWGAFLISLIFSPLIGLLFTLLSKTNTEVNYRKSILRTQKSQQESLEKLASTQKISIADEIEKLERLKESKTISEEDFTKLKNELIYPNSETASNQEVVNHAKTDFRAMYTK